MSSRPRRRGRLVAAAVALLLVATGVLWWRAAEADWFLHRQLEGVEGVTGAGDWVYGSWVRLEPDLGRDEVATVLDELAELHRREGVLAVAPATAGEDAEGTPTTYVELGSGYEQDDRAGLVSAFEALTGLPVEPEVLHASVQDLGDGLWLEAAVDGDPGDLPLAAGGLVDVLTAAGADQVTTLQLSVGVAGGAGSLRASCASGLGGPDGVAAPLIDLVRAQGPGWAVGTAIECAGPSSAELLVQDAEDLAAQRRRAARVLPEDWPVTVGWLGGEVSGRADLGRDPAAVLRALREEDGAELGPLTADLSRVEVTVDDVDELRRVVHRLAAAGAGRVEANLRQQVVAGPAGRLGPRLDALAQLEQQGWDPGFTVLRDGSEVWTVSESTAGVDEPDGADLDAEADVAALVGVWRGAAAPGTSRYLVEGPYDEGILLPVLAFDSAPGAVATRVDDLTVMTDGASREVARRVVAAWDATADE